MTVNKAILVGNLGRDPEVKSTGGGTTVVTMRVATSDRRKSSDGKWDDHTEWHSVVVFGARADAVGRYLQKGSQVYVEGRIQTRKWQDKEGKDRYTTEIVADTVSFLSGRGDGSGRGRPGSRSETPPEDHPGAGTPTEESPPSDDLPYDDDIPF